MRMRVSSRVTVRRRNSKAESIGPGHSWLHFALFLLAYSGQETRTAFMGVGSWKKVTDVGGGSFF